MKYFKFVLTLSVAIGLTYLLNTPLTVGSKTLPALGKFLSPFTGFWQNAEAETPSFNGANFDATQVKDKVEVVFDDRLVPHIFAQNDPDAAFAQGYVTAQQRLFQMDFQTRAASGRLAEWLGPGDEGKIIGFDKTQRRIGMDVAAENALKYWAQYPDLMAVITAYSEGVNAYIATLSERQLPIEYKLLGVQPEAWTPLRTSYLMKMMAKTLVDKEDDIEVTNAFKTFGKANFDFLYPEYFAEQKPVVPDSTWNFKPLVVNTPKTLPFADSAIIKNQPLEKSAPGLGSNNWVVAGSKTASGAPILSNDPHLTLSLPSIWFEIQIKTPTQNTYGVSLPGAPGIVIGFNEHIVWGVTNVSQDVKDWYKIQWTNADKIEYRVDSTNLKAELRIQEIKVKNAASVYDTVRWTTWGPVVYTDGKNAKNDLAMRWLVHDGSADPMTFLLLDRAKNYTDYVNALSYFGSPAQNFAYADREGNIALWVNGKFPLRFPEQGRFIMDGSRGDAAWQGFIPHEQNPHQFNPARGFCMSANQHSTNPTYPYYYPEGNFDENRGRYLNERLTSLSNISPQDMMNLQNDAHSLRPREFLPVFLKFLNTANLSTDEQNFKKDLESWDYNYIATSPAPTMFNEWFYMLKAAAFKESQNKGYPVQMPDDAVLLKILNTPTAYAYLDNTTTPEVETPELLITRTFKDMVKSLKELTDKTGDVTSMAWANHEQNSVNHVLPTLKAFAVNLTEANGTGSAPNALALRVNAAGRFTTGPSWRMVVEMGKDNIKAYAVYPGGQSGNPGSPYYADMIPTWEHAQYNTLWFMPNAEDASHKVIAKQTIY